MANSNLLTTTPGPSPIRTATILKLPTEILIDISQNLCLHCRVPRIGEIPHDDAAVGIREQTALANLSASSKLLYTVAQPILFHFFHSIAGVHPTLRRLTLFVHTISHRPDLAAAVKSLVLWTPHSTDDDGGGGEKQPADAPHLQPAEISEDEGKDKDGTPHDPTACVRAAVVARLEPWWAQQLRARGEPERLASWPIALWELQGLALVLASGAVGCLLLHRTDFREGTKGRDWHSWAHPLERLRHVVLVGWRYQWPRPMYHTYHIKNARALLRCAPNLESLVAVDCGADGDWSPPSMVAHRKALKALPWDVELPRLRRLSINGMAIGMKEVEAIIRHSTVFEDLEFFAVPQYRLDFGWGGGVVLDLERHLGTAKESLKRLCYSTFSIRSPREPDEEEYALNDLDDDEDFEPLWNGLIGFEAGLSFEDFSVLETLELEQLLFYGPVFEWWPDEMENDRSRELVTTDEFLEKLPPSLMHLRMGCIFYWPIVFRDMLAMAEERARFPKLGSVVLEVRRRPPRKEFDDLVEAFQKARITLSICFVGKDPFSRGLLPTRPGFPIRLPQPVSYLKLDS